jgi:hypothetical protein
MTQPIANMAGVQPELREYLELYEKALAGDMVFTVTPATVTPAPTSAAWTREVTVEVTTGAGDLHTWLTKTIASGVSVGDTSTAGTASIASTSLILVNGKAVITVSGDAADWLDTETDTLTVAEATILGYTLSAKTSVETFTA